MKVFFYVFTLVTFAASNSWATCTTSCCTAMSAEMVSNVKALFPSGSAPITPAGYQALANAVCDNLGGSSSNPAGTIIDYGSAACPTGYLTTDGTRYSQSAQSALYNAIGTNWGFTTADAGVVPVMTSDSTPSGVASASSELAAGYEAFRAFDAVDSVYDTNPGHFWLTAVGVSLPQWVQYQFPTAQTINSYQVAPEFGYPTPTYAAGCFAVFLPSAWTLQGSNNGTTWTTVDSRTGVTWAFPPTLTTGRAAYTVATPGSYTYYRWTETAGTPSSCGTGPYAGLEQLILSTSTTLGFAVPDLRNSTTRDIGTTGISNGGVSIGIGAYQQDTTAINGLNSTHSHALAGGSWSNSATDGFNIANSVAGRFQQFNGYYTSGGGVPFVQASAALQSGDAETRSKAFGVQKCIKN